MPCTYVVALVTLSPLAPSALAKLIVASLQFWLLGYEFPTTLMLFTPETLYILTTQKKGAPSNETLRERVTERDLTTDNSQIS